MNVKKIKVCSVVQLSAGMKEVSSDSVSSKRIRPPGHIDDTFVHELTVGAVLRAFHIRF